MVQGGWVSGLEFAGSHLAFPHSLPVEFDLFTGKEGNLSKALLRNRSVGTR